MARKLVIIDGEESKERMIPEPKLYRRIRRAKEIWNAFKFLARGGRFRVYLDFLGYDPRIVKPISLTLIRDNVVVEMGTVLKNAIASSSSRLEFAGLELAKGEEPGFRVRWADKARKSVWEDAGFEAWRTPTDLCIAPKASEVRHD